MAERYLELHNEYRNRWIRFHMDDGAVLDSREINWRRVEWERVVCLEARVNGHTHIVKNDHPNFRFFMNYKASEHVPVPGTQPVERKRVDYWLIGWTDGALCYMKEIEVKSGQLRREFEEPLMSVPAHIHPRVQHLRAAAVPGTKTPEELGY